MKYLKTLCIIGGLSVFFAFCGEARATNEPFSKDLYFGLRANGDVVRLQGFLGQNNYYTGPANGNFFTMTLDAVKKFQQDKGIVPVSGYVGAKTRTAINAMLAGTTQSIQADRAKQISLLQQQIAALSQLLATLQQQLSSPAPAVVPPIVDVATSSAPVVVTVPPATTTPVVATTTVSLPSPFDSTLRIASIFPSLTTSRYTDVVLNELTFNSDEKIAVTSLTFTNSGTLPDYNFTGLKLINSRTNAVLATADMVNGVVKFAMTPDATKSDQGLVVSGGMYNIQANIITPNYGGPYKPTVILDIKSATDVSAFDYNDLKRIAKTPNTSFPVTGPIIVIN